MLAESRRQWVIFLHLCKNHVNIISSYRHNKLRHHLDGNSHWAIFPAARNSEIRLHPTKASRAHYTQSSLFHTPRHSGNPTSVFHSFHHLLLFMIASPPVNLIHSSSLMNHDIIKENKYSPISEFLMERRQKKWNHMKLTKTAFL